MLSRQRAEIKLTYGTLHVYKYIMYAQSSIAEQHVMGIVFFMCKYRGRVLERYIILKLVISNAYAYISYYMTCVLYYALKLAL